MLLNVINAAAGLGSIICFVIVIIHFFQSEQTGLAITCIALLCCGIGGIIAFVKGWMDDLGTVMYVWTVCVLVSLLTNFAIALTGTGPMAN